MGMCQAKEDLKSHNKKKKPSLKSQMKINSGQLNVEYKSMIFKDKIEKKVFEQSFFKKMSQIVKGKFNLNLIFRASQEHYSAQKFHQATNGIKNTILLVKTTQNRIFGAFTPCAWQKDLMYAYQQDSAGRSFIFSLHPQTIQQANEKDENQQEKGEKIQAQKEKQYKIVFNSYKITTKQKAIMNHSGSGPVFGEGHDIYIADRCNTNESWCNLGKSYNCQYPFGSNKANNALAGQSKFLIVEYQVWQIDTQLKKQQKTTPQTF